MKKSALDRLQQIAEQAASKSRPAPVKGSANRGNMKKDEIRPLVMAARQAYDRHSSLGLTEETFDEFRHRIVSEVTGKSGLTELNHGDFRPVLAQFQHLAGHDVAAFRLYMRSGPARGSGPAEDTHEARSGWAHQIRKVLDDHAASGGTITGGFVVWLARNKFRRPNLNFGNDLYAGLAERLSVDELRQLLYTLVNRIAAKEGRGDRRERNKGQRWSARKRAADEQQDDRNPF